MHKGSHLCPVRQHEGGGSGAVGATGGAAAACLQARDKAILHLTRLQEVHAVVNRHPGANLRQVGSRLAPLQQPDG